MIKEPDSGKKTPKRHWIVILSIITVIALFIIIAIFSVFVHRAFVTLVSENSESEYRHGDLYYNSLNYRLQYLYDEITDSAENLKRTTDIIPYYYTEQEFRRVISYIKADRSDLFWFIEDSSELEYDNQKCRVHLSYTNTADEVANMKSVLGQVLSGITAEARAVSDDKSEQILWVHDWLVKNCTAAGNASSEEDHLIGTAYGALVNGKAAADGYSTAFRLICSELEIYCVSVYGRVYNTDHMWNLVWDGSCYRHIDVMWDDPDLSYIPELVSHAYYGLSDEEIELDRVIIREAILPDAEQPADYYHINNMALDGNKDARIIESLIVNCVSQDREWFEISVSDTSAEALEKLIEEKVSTSDVLTGWRMYTLSELYGVFAIQLYYE